MISSWYEATINALTNLWQGFLNFIPELVGALVVFVIGWFIASGIGKLVERVLVKFKFNKLFNKGSWKKALEKAELKVDASVFVGAIIKWILVIVFLLASVEILGLMQFANFLRDVLNYLPNVIVAVLIFVVTFILVDIVEKLVRASVEKVRSGYGQWVSIIVKWSIWIFATLAILHQLKIAQPFLEDLFRGVVAIIVITVGLAFGLGGKDVAAEVIRDVKAKIEGRKRV